MRAQMSVSPACTGTSTLQMKATGSTKGLPTNSEGETPACAAAAWPAAAARSAKACAAARRLWKAAGSGSGRGRSEKAGMCTATCAMEAEKTLMQNCRCGTGGASAAAPPPSALASCASAAPPSE
jgi:hypothetical protein